MINLLSPRAKKKLWREYRTRLAVAVLGACFSLEVLAALLFFPTFVSLQSTTTSLENALDQEKLRSPENSTEIAKQLAVIKDELVLLRPVGTTTDVLPSTLLASILTNKPKGISIDALAYQRDKEKVSIQLSGVASTREDILSFKKILSSNPQFVVARTNDYIIKKTNIAFTINLSLK